MYKVESVHNNHNEDQSWNWECRQVVHSGYPKCKRTDCVNALDGPMFFNCGKDEYIAGTDSFHDNHAEDRRWQFTCCSVTSYKTSSCRLSEFVNDFDGPLSFQAGPGEVITGVFSYHENKHE